MSCRNETCGISAPALTHRSSVQLEKLMTRYGKFRKVVTLSSCCPSLDNISNDGRDDNMSQLFQCTNDMKTKAECLTFD